MDGVLLVNKPQGLTSRDVVDKVSHILKTKKIGHTGTLDPIATGVLVLCIGKATKIVELITDYNKEYIAEVTLGINTDTLDIEGNIIEEVDNINATKDQILESLNGFRGIVEQEVPAYSAIKINGRRLYDYARHNADVKLPKREVEISNISLISDIENVNGKVKFKIKCNVSKGTYIRSLVRDIGKKLGCPACMSALIRTKQGKFGLDACYSINDIENGKYRIITIDEVLSNMDKVIANNDVEQKVRNGNIIDKKVDADIIKIVSENGELLALYHTYDKDNTKMCPYKMFL